MDKNELLKKLYYNPKSGFQGADKLLQKAKETHPDNYWTKQIINDFLSLQKVKQVFAKKKKISIPITALNTAYNYQMDLMDMSRYGKYNKGYNWILCVIDIFSRYAWVRALKTKSAGEVANAIQEIFNSGRVPTKVGSDNGTEFLNSTVQSIFLKYNIIHFTAEVGDHQKQGIVERFNKTLRGILSRIMASNENYNWVDVLPDVIDNYNDSIHSTIKAKPKDVWNGSAQPAKRPFNQKEILDTFESITPGLTVRLREDKNVFSKGTDPTFSSSVFQVKGVVRNKVSIQGKKKLYSVNDILPVGQVEHNKIHSKNDILSEEKKIPSIREVINENSRQELLRRESIEEKNVIPQGRSVRPKRLPARFRD
jgi:hypothetical protein